MFWEISKRAAALRSRAASLLKDTAAEAAPQQSLVQFRRTLQRSICKFGRVNGYSSRSAAAWAVAVFITGCQHGPVQRCFKERGWAYPAMVHVLPPTQAASMQYAMQMVGDREGAPPALQRAALDFQEYFIPKAEAFGRASCPDAVAYRYPPPYIFIASLMEADSARSPWLRAHLEPQPLIAVPIYCYYPGHRAYSPDGYAGVGHRWVSEWSCDGTWAKKDSALFEQKGGRWVHVGWQSQFPQFAL